jgi:hypothetical protein
MKPRRSSLVKLPGAESASVPIEKLTNYCLSMTHPRGRHKARVFLAVFSASSQDAEALRESLLKAAQTGDAVKGITDQYGTRYIIDFEWQHKERTGMIRSSWIVKTGGTSPAFLTCYVL